MKDVAANWQANGNAESSGAAPPFAFINSGCLADPGDQNPGNAPRYYPGLRVNGIHNIDANLSKSFVPKEGMKIDLRAEMFNAFNHPRFAQPMPHSEIRPSARSPLMRMATCPVTFSLD